MQRLIDDVDGLAARRIGRDEDVDVIALMRLNDDRIVDRHILSV